MDVNDFIAQTEIASAQLGFTQALMDPETPEQAAQRLKKARIFDIDPAMVEGVTPEEEAMERASSINWAAAHAMAPVTTERLSEPAFANLVKNDISDMTSAESIIWRMSKVSGVPKGIVQTLRNAFSGGLFQAQVPLFGALSKAEGLGDELDRVRRIEAMVAEGRTDEAKAMFETAEDPSGEVGLKGFLADLPRIKQSLNDRIKRESIKIARGNQYAALFPAPESAQRFMEGQSFADMMGVLSESPGEVITDLGVRSFMQSAPTLIAAAPTGFLGKGVQMASSFATAAGIDRQASLLEGLSKMGVDVTNAEAIAAAFSDPEKRPALIEQYRRADMHAVGTAAFEALGVGVAGAGILPKSISRALADSAYKKRFAEVATQVPMQMAFGSAGEAVGQLMADGEITSLADIVAEGVGGAFGAPVEAFTAGMSARAQVRNEQVAAKQKAEYAQQLAEIEQRMSVGALDPETAADHFDQIARRAGVETVSIDAEAFKSAGFDKKFADIPAVSQQLPKAIAEGGTIDVPFSVASKMIAADESKQLLGMVSIGDTPSMLQAEEKAVDAEAAAKNAEEKARKEAERAAKEEALRSFNAEVAEVGVAVGKQLRALGITREEASGIQAIVQSNVAAVAQQVGMSPKAYWEKYGATYLGEPNISRGPDGKLLVNQNAVDGKGFTQGPLGEYFPKLQLIARWKNANKSTLLHETGHLFLDARMRVATDIRAGGNLTESQKQFMRYVQDALDWFGVKDLDAWNALSVDQQRQYHEKFARSFEAYVMEGRAPTGKLKKAFRDFKAWLKSIYSVIANIPGAELSDEVRAMFDTLFVSEEQVREAAIRNNLGATILNVDALTEEELEEYRQAKDDMILLAEAELNARNANLRERVKNMRDRAARALKKERNDLFQKIRKEVSEEFKQTRTYKAWDLFKNGVEDNGKHITVRMFVGELKALGYRERQIEGIRQEGLTTKVAYRQPLSLSDIAEKLGYANAKELVDDMRACRNAEKRIDEMTLERLTKQRPDLADEKAILDAADAAVFNDAKQKMVSLELAAMERTNRKETKARADAIDAIAYAEVMRMKRSERPGVFVRHAAKASRMARKAWAKGDVGDAIRYKRQELYWTAKANHLRKALADDVKFRKDVRKYRKVPHPGIDGHFHEVLQRALVTMGFATDAQMKLNPTSDSFSKTLRDFEDYLGYAVPISDQLLSALDRRDPSYLNTFDGYFELVDFIKMLEAAGRKEMHLNAANKRAEVAEIQKECGESVRKVALENNRPAKVRMEERGKMAAFKDFMERFGLNHARAAALAAVLDGDWKGKITDLLIYPSDKAATNEANLRHYFTKKLDAIFKPIQKGLVKTEKKTSKIFGVAFDTQQVFIALCNYGNDGNRQRLLATMKTLTGKDFFDGVNMKDPVAVAVANAEADRVMAAFFREYLTDEHFAAAQQIWDLFDEMRQKTDSVARRILGRSPVWVQPRPVNLGGGVVLKGGYYPIVYDRKMSVKSANIAAVDSVESLRPVFGSGGVSDGHLKTRVAVFDKGLVLTSRALSDGLDAQIHYVAWAEFINDARKVLNPDGEIAKAIQDHYGAEYFMAIARWVQDCRNGNAGQNTPLDALPNLLRRNVSLAGIGFNLQTAALQIVGVVQSVQYLGGKWAAAGAAEFLRRGPIGAYRYAAGLSPMMQDRMRTQFREIAEIQSRLDGNTGPLKERFMRAAYMPLVVMQMAVDIPTWLGAYQKAIYEGREETAIQEADRAVMNAQGSGRPSDLSAVERGSAWAKLFTVFYTFFNTVLNLAVVSGKTKSGVRAGIDILMLLMVQPVIETFLKAGASAIFGTGDDDDWVEKATLDATKNVFQFNLGLLVGLREMQWVFDDYGYSGPSGLRKVTDTGRMLKAWEKAITEGEWDERTMRATVSGLGVWVGWPVTPINRAISGGSALADGKTDNPLAILNGYSDKK